MDYENTEEIYDGIIACLNGFIDEEKIRSAQTHIRNQFGQDNTINKLLELYTESAWAKNFKIKNSSIKSFNFLAFKIQILTSQL